MGAAVNGVAKSNCPEAFLKVVIGECARAKWRC